MGWQIVRHSFVLLFRNLPDALKVSVGPLLIGLVLVYVLSAATGMPWSMNALAMMSPAMMNVAGHMPPSMLLVILASLLLVLFVSSWIAVAWHRFVLLEEYPGLVPALNGQIVLAYLGRAILLALVMILIAFPLSMVAGLITMPFMSTDSLGSFMVVGALVGIAMAAILSWFWLRFGLVLPAVSVGRQIGMGDSWRATAPRAGDIFVATIILFAINTAASLLVDQIFGGGLIGQALSLVITWISLMVGISILTTLYGMQVENRSISQT